MAPSTSDLPSAADHGERLNRMNMVLAKHSSALAALKRVKPSTAPVPTTVSKAIFDSSKSKTSSFSALKGSSAADPAATSDASSQPQQRDVDDEDDNFGSLNAGIGFVPAGKEIAQGEHSAATRDLRGKLLGKRAREQKENAAAARKKQKGRVDEDESDENEGRSKIGKGRKKWGKFK